MPITSISDLVPGIAQSVASEIDMVEDFHVHLSSKTKDVRAPGIHATELSSCLRKVYYTLTRERKIHLTDAVSQKRFEHGKAVHSWIQEELHRMSRATGRFTFEDEIPTITTALGKEYNITSSCDGVLTFVDKDSRPKYRIGVEIKSSSPDTYAKRKAPEPEHVKQAHLYMLCLDIPLMWIMYFNKGNQNITPMKAPWLIQFDPALGRSMLDEIEEVTAGVQLKQIPERTINPYCRDCYYAHVCEPPHVKTFQGETRVPQPIRR